MFLYLVVEQNLDLEEPVALCLLETVAEELKEQGETRTIHYVAVDFDLDFTQPLWVFMGYRDGFFWHTEISEAQSDMEEAFRRWTKSSPPGPIASGDYRGSRIFPMSVLPPQEAVVVRREDRVDLSDDAILPLYREGAQEPYGYRLEALGFSITGESRDAVRRQFLKQVRQAKYRWADKEHPEDE